MSLMPCNLGSHNDSWPFLIGLQCALLEMMQLEQSSFMVGSSVVETKKSPHFSSAGSASMRCFVFCTKDSRQNLRT